MVLLLLAAGVPAASRRGSSVSNVQLPECTQRRHHDCNAALELYPEAVPDLVTCAIHPRGDAADQSYSYHDRAEAEESADAEFLAGGEGGATKKSDGNSYHGSERKVSKHYSAFPFGK